jgi:hypothetical protein
MSALTTHTFDNQREKRKEKKRPKETPTSDRKLRKGKEQDHLKKTSLRNLRQGQWLDTPDKTMLKQRAQTTKAYKSFPCTYAYSPWTSANSRHRPVRPVPKTSQTGSTKTGQAGYQNQSDRFGTADHTPQKQKILKKCTSSPLTLGIGSRDAMQFFSTFLSPPCCQCMNQGSNLKICNLELLKYTKFITRCNTCPNEQVRYSIAS